MRSHRFAVTAFGLACLLGALAIAGHLAASRDGVAGCGADGGCVEALRSRWSQALGVPVGVLGVLAYGGTILVGSLASRSAFDRPSLRDLETSAFVLVLAAAAWFGAVQVALLDALCPYCCAAHALAATGVIFLWVIRPRPSRELPRGPVGRALLVGWPVAAVAGLAAIQTLGPAPERLRSGALPASIADSGDGERRLALYDGEIVIDPDALPAIGSVAGVVTGVLLTDWTCPHCLELHRMLDAIASDDEGEVGFVLIPGHRTAEARGLHRVMLTLWRADPSLYRAVGAAIVAGEIEPAAASAVARARETMAEDFFERAFEHASWVEETLRTGERLLHENDSRLDAASLPQLMIGDRVLVGVPRRETLVELVRASAGTPPRAEKASGPTTLDRDPKAPVDEAGLVFTSRSLDMGVVAKGDVAVGRFEFRNTSAEPISITRLHAACGCTAVEGWRQTVEPGQTGRFDVRLDTRWLRDRVSKPIDIETNASRSATRLEVLATVWSPVRMTPPGVSFRHTKDSKREPKLVRITVTDTDPLSIREVRTTNEFFRAELREIEPGRIYDVVVSIPEGEAEEQRGEVVIPLDHPRLAEERLPLYFNRLEGVRVSPKVILRTGAPPNRPTRHMISVDGEDPAVPVLEISDLAFVGGEGVTLELEAGGGFQSRKVVVTFPAGFDAAAAEAAGAHLSFATNHPDHASVRVPVRVTADRRE